ncbi:polyprenyl synthetase family protein [Candidatus Riflebacteria bacterium]
MIQEFIPDSELKLWKKAIDNSIRKSLTLFAAKDNTLVSSMRYSLFSGGKRFRPLLLLLTLKSFGKNLKAGHLPAAAIEMIHTYSLIHDDLPVLDNDDYRRGKLANHKVYGEACALLSGDALLTLAFATLAQAPVTAEKKIKMVLALANASGAKGMILGQCLELETEAKLLSKRKLIKIHLHKTGKLINAAVCMAGIIAGLNEQIMKNLTQFGTNLGLIFQLTDDILDMDRDQRSGQNSYSSFLGLQETKKMIKTSAQKADTALQKIPLKKFQQIGLLKELIKKVCNRSS